MNNEAGNPKTEPPVTVRMAWISAAIIGLGLSVLAWMADEDETPARAMNESECRKVFDGLVKAHSWTGMHIDVKECSPHINKWALELPAAPYTTTGSALLVNGAAYSLVGARATRDAVKYADTQLETVVVRLPEGGVTLRFQNAEQADAALLAIGNAMGQARVGN